MNVDDRDSWLQRIGELVDRAAYRQALKVCDQALVAHPDLAEAHDFRGLILCRMGRYREALPAYDRAISLEPQFVTALLDKAELLVFYLQEDEEAVALADRVLRLHSQDLDAAHALHLKGIAYANLGLHEEALGCFEKSIAIDPEYPDTHCERGVSLMETYRFADALKALKAAIALDPGYPRPHAFLSALYEHLGETATAARESEAATQADPEGHPAPPSLEPEDFAAAVEEARHVVPRDVSRLLDGVEIRCEWLPGRDLLAEGILRASATSARLHDGDREVIVLFQRNLERLGRTRADVVEEIVHALSHEVGHPEDDGGASPVPAGT